MWPEYNGIFGTACVGMAVLSTIWLFLAGNWSKYLGAGAAAFGAIIVAGIWLGDPLSWIWRIHQITMLTWLMTFVLMGLGVAFGFRQQGTSKWLSVIVGLLAFGLNAISILMFLWMATVSAGGV